MTPLRYGNLYIQMIPISSFSFLFRFFGKFFIHPSIHPLIGSNRINMRRAINVRTLRNIQRQRRGPQPVNAASYALGDHVSLNGYYNVQVNALQSTVDNLARFMDSPHTRLLAFADGYFDPNDTIDVVFTARNDIDVNNVPSGWLEEDIRYFVLETIGIPRETPIRLTMDLTRMSYNQSRQWLGGAARVVYAYATTDDIRLDEFMHMMWDRMYLGFNFSDIRVEVSIPMIAFLRARIRGGQVISEDQLAKMFRDIPLANHSLALYDYWPPSLKGNFRRKQMQCGPNHLRDVKGLLFYEWRPEWYPYCGIMAIFYSRLMVESQNVMNLFARFAIDHESFLDACKEQFKTLLDKMDMLQKGDVLYKAAKVTLDQIPDLIPIASFPTLHQLGVLSATLYPTFTLVVYDQSRHILFRHSGPACSLKDPPERRYQKGELTSDIIQSYTDQRICVYYDHLTEHFLPIFNLSLFLHRRKIDMACRVDGTIEENRLERAKVVPTKDRAMTYCPYCDRGIYKGKETEHECHQLRCFCCQTIFFNISELMKHIDPSLQKPSFKCRACGQKCFGKMCFRKHGLICNKTVYLRCYQCQRNVLKKFGANHRCHKYFCNNCEKDVLNPIVYNNPNHPEGYIKYHRCAMRTVNDSTKSKNSNEKETTRLFFAFDFESRLDRDVFKDIVIHIHVVNCISSAPIFIAQNQKDCVGLEKLVTENTFTQYTLLDFWNHLVAVSIADENVWIAHNFKGYDGRILYDFLVHEMGIVPCDIIKTGGKIMKLVFVHPFDAKRRLVFQDSLCHIATSLAMMPAMFGLDTRLIRKGYFPYKFNTIENEHYVGPIPDKSFFEYDMIPDKADFDAWYIEKAKEPYDFKHEMTRYCENDVLVLSLSLSNYMTICLEYSFGINPMTCLTIAQFTFYMYRTKFLPDNTVYFLDESLDTFARRALHGGNTNTRRLFYACTPEEAGTIQNGCKGLRYIDVQSLYPTVQYYDPMPVGYPTTNFFSQNQQPSQHKLRTFFGFIECDLTPYKFTFHPFIARYANKRLSMDLHPHKRVVITSVEFQAAVFGENAYCTCDHVYRIDEYIPSTDLFKSFIQVWLKLKIISSKPPKEETFSEFKKDLKERLNIDVEWSDFNFNPSLRTLAKLVLNSLWGKFGQRTRMPKTKIFQTANQLYDYYEKVRMGLYEEKEHAPVGSVSFIKKYVELQEWNKKNAAIACFTTAHARLRLGSVLAKLGNRVLYHDTDSVIYERRHAEDWMVPEGKYLGDWESETGDQMIYEFVSLAPKTYAYRYKNSSGEVVEYVKSKGFSLNKQTREQLCFDNYKRLIFGEAAKIDVLTTFFRHSEEAGFTFTNEGTKSLTFNYSKGFIDWDNFETLPYGSQRFLQDYERPITVCDENDLVLKVPKPRRLEEKLEADDDDDMLNGFFDTLLSDYNNDDNNDHYSTFYD